MNDQQNRPEDENAGGQQAPPPPASFQPKPPEPTVVNITSDVTHIDTNQATIHEHLPQKRIEHEPSEPKKGMTRAEWYMTVLTAAIAIATIGNVIVFYFESEAAGGQTKTLATYASQQTCAAQRFAKSAGEISTKVGAAEADFANMATNSANAIKATQEEMRLDERAWVGVESPNVVINKTGPIKTEARVIVLGKSPAVGIITEMGMRPFPPGHILELADIVLDQKEIPNGTAVPGSNFPIRETGETPVTPSETEAVQAVLDKKLVIYFFGKVNYRDIFNSPHWTHFCITIPSGDSNDIFPCKIYNDTDADHQTKSKKTN